MNIIITGRAGRPDTKCKLFDLIALSLTALQFQSSLDVCEAIFIEK